VIGNSCYKKKGLVIEILSLYIVPVECLELFDVDDLGAWQLCYCLRPILGIWNTFIPESECDIYIYFFK
jgi:hypothetical protein